MIYVADDAPGWLEPARALIAEGGVSSGVTCLPGVLIGRWLGPDARTLRAAYARFATRLRLLAAGLPERPSGRADPIGTEAAKRPPTKLEGGHQMGASAAKGVRQGAIASALIGFKMWMQAVEQAGTTEVDAVRQAMYGQQVKNLTGGVAVMNPNHHLSKPVLIGEIQDDGQFEVVWETDDVVVGDAWSHDIPESAKLTADWTFPWVCGNCEAPKHNPS